MVRCVYRTSRACRVCAAFALMACASWATVGAQSNAEVPTLLGHVNDYARVLSSSQTRELEARLVEYETQTGHQFALLTIPTLAGNVLEHYSLRVAHTWRLGRHGVDDGLLLVLAIRERAMRIEIGYGLEGSIPDVAAARVIRETLTPALRRNDFAAGINAAFEALMRAGSERAQPLRLYVAPKAHTSTSWGLLLVPLFVPLLLLRLLGSGRVHRSDPDAIYSDSIRRTREDAAAGRTRSRDHEPPREHSGWSGGGGRFGGGGASGRW